VRTLATLLRLLWRPFTLWSAFLCYSLTIIVWMVASMARGGMRDLSRATPAQIEWNLSLELALGTVLLPLAFGAALSWQVFDLLVCPGAAHLPGVRRRLFRALLAMGLVGAALTAWWCDESPGAQNPALFAALAFPWFALGFACGDPIALVLGPGRGLVQLLALGLVLLAPEWVAAGEGTPFLVAPLAVAVGLGLLWAPFSRRAQRLRLAVSADSPAIRMASQGAGGWQVLGPRARRRAGWNPGRTLLGVHDWTRAALHEGFGHLRGGWLGAVIGFGLVWSLVLLVLGFVRGFGDERDGPEALRSLYAMLTARVPGVESRVLPLPALALPIWASMFLVSNPFTPRGAGAYPLGRGTRARVAWRASVLLVAGLVLSLAVVLGGASEILFRLSDLERRAGGVPHFAHALAGLAIAAPLAHLLRLRWIESRPHALSPWVLPALIGMAGLGLGLPGVGLALFFREVWPHGAVLPWLVLVLALSCASQLLWKRALERHYRSADLSV